MPGRQPKKLPIEVQSVNEGYERELGESNIGFSLHIDQPVVAHGAMLNIEASRNHSTHH